MARCVSIKRPVAVHGRSASSVKTARQLTQAQLINVGIVGPDGDCQNEQNWKPLEDRYADVALIDQKIAFLRADELVLSGLIDAVVYVHVGGRAVIGLRHFDICAGRRDSTKPT